jgi:DNA-binding winged helix-turn-helix (wHTH) protein
LGSKDLRTDDLIFHNKLNEVVLQNIQWMPELSLESQEQLIIKESSIRSFELSKILMNSIIKYAYGDPTVLKELIIKCMTSENIADLLVENSIDSQQIYNELNKTVLENHYYKILKAFSSTELERFISGKFQLDDYSVNTGLIEKYELQWRFKSHLFEYFVNKKFDKSLLRNYLMNGKELYEETKTSNLQEFKNGLTGQELNMMNILIEKKNNIVSRDEIAKRIWPEDYMVEYSDWAIDKTASRLRKKVKDANVGLEIKVVKGKGYILS